MEKADLSEELGKNQASPSKFPRDAKHPLTQGFWKENDLSKKQKGLSDVLEKNQKALSSSKNEILNKRLEDIISKTQTELNSVVEEIKKRKTC